MSHAARRQSPVQAERRGQIGPAERQQDRDGLALKAAETKLEHVSGGTIQPLGVVHRHEQGGSAGKDPECVQRPTGEDVPIGHGSQRSAACESEGHGLSPAFRKFRKKLLDNVAEQIVKCREGEWSLRGGWPARENPEGRSQGRLYQVLPHHGLADSDVPGNGDRRRLARAGRKKGANLAYFGLTSNRPRVQLSPPVRL